MLQLLHEDYAFTYPHVCSQVLFIRLSELWQCCVNEIAKVLKWQQEDSKTGSLS